MNGPSLLELTLFVADVDRSFAFYTALGVDLFLVEEPGHPRHYDGALGNTAVQIYPADDRPATTVQLGFRVPDIAAIAHRLDGVGVLYELPLRHRLTTRDPDGNRVHLSQLRDNMQD
ncbi:MAG: VOC family protein [Mycobacterium sp.]